MNKESISYKKLVCLLISNDKKLVILFLAFIITGFTFLFTISSLTETIVSSRQEEAVRKYGKFLAVIPKISEEEEEEISEEYGRFTFEHFRVSGNVEYEGQKIALGSMKESMGETLGFELIQGEWPQDSGQIVAEEYLLDLFGAEKKALPFSISLQTGEGSLTYEVTGVISNYSAYLPVPDGSVSEIKTYPSIICGETGAAKPGMAAALEERYSLALSQKKLNLKQAEKDLDFLSGLPMPAAFNVDLCHYGYKDLKDFILTKTAYLIFSNLLLLLAQIIIIRAFLLRNRKTLFLLETFGMSRRGKRWVLLCLVCGLILTGLAAGGLLAAIMGVFYQHYIFKEYVRFYMSALVSQVFIEGIIVSLFLMAFYFSYDFMKKETVIGEIMEKPLIRPKKYRFRKFDFQIILLQTVCIFFVMMSCYIMNNFQGEIGNPIYDLYSKRDAMSYPVGEYYRAEYGEDYFSFDDLEIFKKYKDFLSLSAEADTKFGTILLEKDHVDSYFKRYYAEDVEELRAESAEVWEQIAEQAEKYEGITAYHVQFMVLPQKEFRLFLKEKGLSDLSVRESGEKTCVLCLPDGKKDSSVSSVREKEMVRFGGVRKIKGKTKFFTEKFQVAAICRIDEEEYSTIQVVMEEETAKKSELVFGYDKIHLEVKEGTPEPVNKEIEKKILAFMASVQGGFLDSSGERNRRDDLVRNYGSAMSGTILFFSISVIWIYIIFNIYIDQEKHKLEYGILRSFGMSYQTLQNKLFYRYSISILIAATISILLGKFFDIYSYLPKWQVIFSFGTTAGITVLCRLWVYRKYRRESVSSMLSKNQG